MALINFWGSAGARIDGPVFRLHYRLTTTFFLVFSVVELVWIIFGSPVSCTFQQVPTYFSNVVCWLKTTYVSVPASDSGNSDLPHPGVFYSEQEPERDYQLYYQWIPFMLALHGLLFYVPHWLWVACEDGRMAAMVQDVRLPVPDRAVLRARVASLATYVRQNLGSHEILFVLYVFCDALNIVNVIATFFMINKYLDGKFRFYGNSVVKYLKSNETDIPSPFDIVFPKVTTCDYNQFGGSGTLQRHGGVCALPMNFLNEKLYLFVWFWLIVLSVITCVVFLCRLVAMLVTELRVRMLEQTAYMRLNRTVRDGLYRLSVGDFFLMTLLAQNMSSPAFRLLLTQLAKANFNRLLTDEEPEPEPFPSAPQSEQIPMLPTAGPQKRTGYAYPVLSTEPK